MLKISEKILLLPLGFGCNNNCLFCSTAYLRDKIYSFSKIKNEINKINGKIYDKIEFLGGEPTIHPDLIKSISLAKKVGFKKISITTNGRMLSESNIKKLIMAGLNDISITLYSNNKKIHDATTRSRGSFDQTIMGIKNSIKYVPNLFVNTVIFKFNYQQLINMADYINNMGIKNWHLMNLIPQKNANIKTYKKFAAKLHQLSEAFLSLQKIKNLNMFFFDFPHCIFNKLLVKKKNIMICDIHVRHNTDHIFENHISKRTQSINNEITDFNKIITSTCKICKFKSKCGGIFKEYNQIYGFDELTKLRLLNLK